MCCCVLRCCCSLPIVAVISDPKQIAAHANAKRTDELTVAAAVASELAIEFSAADAIPQHTMATVLAHEQPIALFVRSEIIRQRQLTRTFSAFSKLSMNLPVMRSKRLIGDIRCETNTNCDVAATPYTKVLDSLSEYIRLNVPFASNAYNKQAGKQTHQTD